MITLKIEFKEEGLSLYNFQDYYRGLLANLIDDPTDFPDTITLDERMIYRVVHYYLFRERVKVISGVLDVLSPEAIAFLARSLSGKELTIYTRNPNVLRSFLEANLEDEITVIESGNIYSGDTARGLLWSGYDFI